MFIKTYSRGGLEQFDKLDLLTPDTDVIISIRDTNSNQAKFPDDISILDLEFDDVSHLQVDKKTLTLCETAISNKEVEKVKKLASKNQYPTLPMCYYHADLLEKFIYENVGFSRNIHINCTYGRSRSVAIAKFLSDFIFPTHKLEISREDSRVNPWVYKLLMKKFGYI